MKFEAIATMILWHEGVMCVFNKGDKGDLPDDVVQPYIDAGNAVEFRGRLTKSKSDPKPDAGTVADASEDASATDADAPPV